MIVRIYGRKQHENGVFREEYEQIEITDGGISRIIAEMLSDGIESISISPASLEDVKREYYEIGHDHGITEATDEQGDSIRTD